MKQGCIAYNRNSIHNATSQWQKNNEIIERKKRFEIKKKLVALEVATNLSVIEGEHTVYSTSL